MPLRQLSPLWLAMCLSVACIATSTDPDDDTEVEAPPFCEPLGLPTTPFRTDATTAALAQIAGEFTVETTDGPWVFSERFTGCSSYVFFVHFPGVTDQLMRTELNALIEQAPDNVEYFFLTDADNREDRTTFLDDMSASLDDALDQVLKGKAKKDAWRQRFHFVTQRASNIDGSVGEFVNTMVALSSDPAARADLGERGSAPVPLPIVFGIDRDQRFDAGGSLSPYVGAPGDELGMATWLAHFYNYRHALDARFRDEPGVTVVPVLDELTTGRVFTLPVTLPSASEMAEFDRLEFDVTIDCQLVNPFACSEWDRIAWIWLCTDGEACTQRLELARWITPYWRRGRQRYALEASPMIALLREGGDVHLYVELGPSWERATEWDVDLSLRFSDTGGPRPLAAVPAFTGGGFGETYNDRTPVPFTPPAGTTRAELVALITGHGQTAGDNCAEWCDHRHTFAVDGTDLPTVLHEGTSIGADTGCAERANQGVMPGQWGNWSQSRAYWCPGMAVTPHRLDMTSLISAGTEGEIGYRASFGAGEPRGGDIALSSYVVFYGE